MTRRLRPAKLVAGAAVATSAFGIVAYEAWWMISLVVFAVAVVYLDRRLGAGANAIVLASVIGGLVLVGSFGVFLMAMSPFAHGAPIFWVGVVALVLATTGLVITVRLARRLPTKTT